MNSIEIAKRVMYLPVIKKYFEKKHKIKKNEIELLIFIYAQRTFKLRHWYGYRNLFSWTPKTFANMKEAGYLKYATDKGGIQYASSVKTDKLMGEFFALLEDDAYFDPDESVNPMFKRETHTDKVYSNFMKRLNKERSQRPAPVLYDTDDSEF